MNNIPNLFIPGAAKSGTTSLWWYLSQHPEIFGPAKKEPMYFSSRYVEFPYTGPGDWELEKEVIRNLNEYKECYNNSGDPKYLLDASTSYLYYPQCAEDIKSANPDAKIIIILRNPVERAFSSYMHQIRDGYETLSFSDALAMEDDGIKQNYQHIWHYKRAGLYYESVKKYLEVFGEINVKVILFEDFITDPESSLNDMLSYLGLYPHDFDKSVLNKSGVIRHRFLYIILQHMLTSDGCFKKILKKITTKNQRMRFSAFRDRIFISKTNMNIKDKKILEDYYADDISYLSNLLKKNLWQPKRCL